MAKNDKSRDGWTSWRVADVESLVSINVFF
jgi:hypothetical protein